MNNSNRFRICVVLALSAITISVQGGELLAGAGFGEQVGFQQFPQNNAVVDVLYDACGIDWYGFRFSAGGGVTWLWNDFDETDVLICHIFPQFRYTIPGLDDFQPYLFVITGFAYMTEPHLGQQALGGHFAFNDFFGAGAYIGSEQVWSINCCWRHISNAGIFDPNEGIDVPYSILIGRRF